MKTKFLAPGLLALSWLVLRPASAADRPISFQEAYQLAIKTSETYAQQADTTAAALARIDELKGSVLPHIYLLASELLQENPHLSGSLSSISQSSLPQAQLQLTQPLFSGFRDLLALKAGKAHHRSAAYDEARAKSLLYQGVGQAYLDVWRIQREIKIRRQLVTDTLERISQLGRFIKIGRSRTSEVIAARSQLAQTEAQVEIALGEELGYEQILQFLTGLNDHLVPQDLPLPGLEPLDLFLAMTVNRSDVLAREEDVNVARFGEEITRRQRFPTIGLTADYYFKRTGIQENIHYDALFSASFPIFDSGLTTAQVRESEAGRHSTEEALTLARRSAERDVRTAYENLRWTLSALKAFDKAVDLAGKNVKAQAHDYRLSLVTNLDVLDSLTSLASSQLVRSQTQEQAILAHIQLLVASGGPDTPEKSGR